MIPISFNTSIIAEKMEKETLITLYKSFWRNAVTVHAATQKHKNLIQVLDSV